MTSSTDEGQDWTAAVDEFLAATQLGIYTYQTLGSIPFPNEELRARARREVSAKIASNIFQFVEKHGQQGGRHAESEPRSGAQGRTAEPGGDAERDAGVG